MDFLDDLEREIKRNPKKRSSQKEYTEKNEETTPEIDLDELERILLTPTKAWRCSYLLSKTSDKGVKSEIGQVKPSQNSDQVISHRISTPHKNLKQETHQD